MGEVGGNSVDDPHVNLKMNGGINGNCEDEPMDVADAQNTSQNPNESVRKIVDDESVSMSDDKIPETNDNIQAEDKLNKKQCDDSNSEHTMDIGIDHDCLSQENGSSLTKKTCDDSNEAIDLNKSSESDLIVEEPTNIEHGGIETNTSEKSDDNPPITHKNSIEIDVANKNDTKRSTSIENGTSASDMLEDSDNLLKPISQAEDDVVHAISDSDDDGDNDIHEVEPKNLNPMDTSDDVTELDNNLQSLNGVNKIVLEDEDDDDNDDDDDDKPVSIHSDSDSEHEANKDEVHEILSDKEDCVVIEDDKKLDGNDLSIRPVNRARKSAVRPRDFSTFDDDIEEIIEDPLEEESVPKKPRLNDPLTQSDESQNQSNKSNEPTLVIIDTNTILSRGSTSNAQAGQTNVQSLNDGAQSYSIDSRTSITPVPNNNQMANVTSTTLAGLNAPVLTALTDDMFVLEAPSFIVPYIYEKPPSTELRDIVTKIGIEIEERKALEELEKKKKDAEKQKEKEQEKEMDKEKDKDSNDDEDGDDAKETDKSDDEAEKKTKKRKSNKNGDESWDESDVSTDDDVSDIEETKVLIKEAKTDLDTIQTHIISRDITKDSTSDEKKDSNNYFDSPLGKFFMDIGINLVQEHVQTDLLRQQKRKLNREGNKASPDVQQAINSLMKNLELSKGKNDPFKFETKRCEYCYFKSESSLVMAHHYETPHMKGNLYKCNFCAFEIKPPYEILLHMQNVHNIKARLEKALSYHQCPNCLFEDNGKSKLARHAVVCSKKFRPEVNLAPPVDWDPPAKIPRIKPRHGLVGTANAYQAMAAQAQRAATAAAIQRQNAANAAAMKNRGRPQTVTKTMPTTNNNMRPQQPAIRPQVAGGIVLPNNFQVTNPGQFIQATSSKSQKNSQQPSISITALPRQTQPNPSTTNLSPSNALQQASILPKPPGAANVKPGQTQSGGKASFVICEICDGWIKDLDQLRNHMQWMHKVKIHPKMIYNRPPLNCQKCQFRFFTDQGLERHLLGSHGLVTSSMQEAANKGKDAGRCPVCGRMYQWKLLNHVSREHNMTLKPAHLSYKCTVCTATFGMYKQFENHVYSAHSTVAKRSNEGAAAKKSSDGKSKSSSTSSSASSINVGSSSRTNPSTMVPGAGASMLKPPFKINDEITITPQPATRSNRPIEIESHVID